MGRAVAKPFLLTTAQHMGAKDRCQGFVTVKLVAGSTDAVK